MYCALLNLQAGQPSLCTGDELPNLGLDFTLYIELGLGNLMIADELVMSRGLKDALHPLITGQRFGECRQ